MQSEIYAWLRQHSGWRSIKSMAKALKIDQRQRISRKLVQLEKFGFVEKKYYDNKVLLYRVKE